MPGSSPPLYMSQKLFIGILFPHAFRFIIKIYMLPKQPMCVTRSFGSVLVFLMPSIFFSHNINFLKNTNKNIGSWTDTNTSNIVLIVTSICLLT